MINFTNISYDALQVGEEFVSEDLLIKPENVEAFAFSIDDQNPWYFKETPFGGSIAPPVIIGNQALRLRNSRYIVMAGLHAKMQFEFIEPLRVGIRVRSYGKIIDKYEKRGRQYMVTEFITKDEDTGEVLTRGQFTQMLFPD